MVGVSTLVSAGNLIRSFLLKFTLAAVENALEGHEAERRVIKLFYYQDRCREPMLRQWHSDGQEGMERR